VIPKRHARRSVTRNLLRRQIRAVMTDQLAALPPGLWLVRLRTPFAKDQFVSAASDALRDAARSELQQLFQRAVQPGRRAERPDRWTR
jgi:ribonuclease P protein component